MPRPVRCRCIDNYPEYWGLDPLHAESHEQITLSLDEYETIRLIDRLGMTQEQCAEKMGVARTTVTAIYDSARGKLAECLVDGKALRISGGSYKLNIQGTENIKMKGAKAMRIAATYENGEVFQHFGHTESFKLYDVEDGKITDTQIVDTNGNGHGALAGFLKESGADALICGGIGMGARNALAEAGIDLYAGVEGDADKAVEAFLAGNLESTDDATCDHHGHEHHHGEGHECGHGNCGNH